MKKLLITGSIIASILLGGCASKNENKIETIKKEDISNFKNVVNPSEELQIRAVKSDYRNLQYINNPSLRVKLNAIKQNAEALTYINNPTEDFLMNAIRVNNQSLKYINNPTEDFLMNAIRVNNQSLKYINNPTEDFLISVIQKEPKAIEYINNPSEKILLEIVNKDGLYIKNINNPSEKIQIAAVINNKKAFELIENPSEYVKSKLSKMINKISRASYKINGFVLFDKNININVIDSNKFSISNNTNTFINISMLSFYYGNNIKSISNIKMPPKSTNTIEFSNFDAHYGILEGEKVNFGFAVEYRDENKTYNLNKINKYYLTDFLKGYFFIK
ncbi:hypothetical protein [Aliarcobacter skirrowii]|uniref:hypothetical protein n=1 Tax=Aliarcobacter skirrowii TaxID=28200 RepID=UPI0029A189CA|nr:hypothetical protein [Aliarcobacter skirrowii]MDX4028393.1 hypothetical protein [Aliarcobacter skirrowii]